MTDRLERPRYWPFQYEKDETGHALPPEEQYGGGGLMSEDYHAAMQALTFMGIEKPWDHGQVERFGYVILPKEKRATYVNPNIQLERI